MSKYEIAAIGFIGLGFFAIILFITDGLHLISLNEFDKVGAYIGGVAGSLWALGGVIFLYETLRIHKDEFETTRQRLRESQNENLLFNLFSQLYALKNSITDKSNTEPIKVTGKSSLKSLFNSFKELHNEDFLKEYTNAKTRDSRLLRIVKDDSVNMKIEAVVSIYESFYERHHDQLGHYFRFIYNIIKFIVTNFNRDDHPKYIGLLQAQLSNSELGLIAFNCISKHGRNSEGKYQFYEWINFYEIIENIDPHALIDESYSDFFPNVTFKFKNR